jgi:glycogen operon protein
VVPFKLPDAVGGSRWVRLIDTNQEDASEVEKLPFGHEYIVSGRSLLLFILQPTHTKGNPTDAELSYAFVMQAFEEASSEPLALPGRA